MLVFIGLSYLVENSYIGTKFFAADMVFSVESTAQLFAKSMLYLVDGRLVSRV